MKQFDALELAEKHLVFEESSTEINEGAKARLAALLEQVYAMRAPTDLTKQTELARQMDDRCYQKAKARGEQTFTLVAQDRSSPKVICEWIKENIETCPTDKLLDALLDAIAMRSNPNRKSAD